MSRGAAMCERLHVIDQLLAAGGHIHAATEGGPALQMAADLFEQPVWSYVAVPA